MNEENFEEKSKNPKYIFVGCLFIGLAIGMYLGRPDIGVLAGLGVGFIGMFIANLFLNK